MWSEAEVELWSNYKGPNYSESVTLFLNVSCGQNRTRGLLRNSMSGGVNKPLVPLECPHIKVEPI